MEKVCVMFENIKHLCRYNPWNGNDISAGYRRGMYLDKIAGYMENNLVKVLTGQRRAGKSYILRQMVMDMVRKGINAENIFYISKEFTAFDFLQTYKDLDNLIEEYRCEFHPEGKTYIFIDEIQNIEGWERTVNSLSQDFSWPCEVFISGSNSNMLSGELASLLSGRYVEFEILPLSFTEWASIHSKGFTRNDYTEFLVRSGLPEMIYLGTEEVCRNYVSSLKDTILLRDVINRHKIRDANTLEDLFVYVVNNATKLFTPNTIVKYYKGRGKTINYDTVTSYLSFMTETYIIHKAERYNIQGKETISGNCKYYVNDLAFYNYLYKGFAYGYGYELENLVYLELRRAGYDVYVGNIPSARTGTQVEVDFVAVKGEERIYVQVAYEINDEATLAREYGSLEMIDDNYPKYIVTLDQQKLPNKDGIKHIQAWNFENELSRL